MKLDNNATTMFKAQKGSKDIIKIVHVTFVVQPEDWHEREEFVEKSYFCCFFVYRKYSRSFIKLCLKH